MQLFKNLKVHTKLFILIGLSLLITIIIGSFAFIQTKSMSTDMTKIYEEKFIPNEWITDAVNVNLRIDSIIIQMILSENADEQKQLYSEINDGVDQVLTNLATYEAMDLSAAEQEELAKFHVAVNLLINNQDEVIHLALEGDNDAAYALFKKVVQDARTDLITSLNNLSKLLTQQTGEISETNTQAAKNTATSILLFISLAVIILLLLGSYIIASIVKPIQQLKHQLTLAQAGDFTARGLYVSKDELGDLTTSFNQMVKTLQDVMQRVKSSATHVDAAAYELSANIQQSTATTEHVVSSIQEIAGGSEQTKLELENNTVILQRVINGFDGIRDTISSIDMLTKIAFTEAQAGTTIVSDNVKQMKQIQQSIQQSNTVIQTLATQVGEVDEILKVINNISEQTNLLALNAAIEAARAGEHGKGFAVVAAEVRKLAEQSLTSTKSIAEILANIKKDTVQSVDIMDVVMKEANKGRVTTETTADKFKDILNNTNAVAPKMKEMSTIVQNMTGDMQNFSSNAGTILTIAVNNAKNSELVSSATEQQAQSMEDMNLSARGLTNVASELNQVVQQFKL